MIFYCRSYCLLYMFRALLCRSSGARELRVVCQVCGLLRYSPQTGYTTLSSTPYRQLENQAPNTTGSNHLYNTLELLLMGIMVPETCWASNKICNKNSSVASSWHFISTYYVQAIHSQCRFCKLKMLYMFKTFVSLLSGHASYTEISQHLLC